LVKTISGLGRNFFRSKKILVSSKFVLVRVKICFGPGRNLFCFPVEMFLGLFGKIFGLGLKKFPSRSKKNSDKFTHRFAFSKKYKNVPSGAGGVPKVFVPSKSYFFCDLKPHAEPYINPISIWNVGNGNTDTGRTHTSIHTYVRKD
jgi:hypothetical protein